MALNKPLIRNAAREIGQSSFAAAFNVLINVSIHMTSTAPAMKSLPGPGAIEHSSYRRYSIAPCCM
jgi:hypothetical protein